jgi:hypothetical protein
MKEKSIHIAEGGGAGCVAYYFCKSISSNAKEIRAACPSSGKVMNGNDRGGRPFSLPSEAQALRTLFLLAFIYERACPSWLAK